MPHMEHHTLNLYPRRDFDLTTPVQEPLQVIIPIDTT
uniref:Uncharacterized protein n=1 Tax=Nitrosopumivirus cobalaminus TaxID=3158414 RepID=A0AAU7N451_9VIRU